MNCEGCNGSGACDPCDGYGVYPDSYPGAGDGPECEICAGSGCCPDCHGSGMQTEMQAAMQEMDVDTGSDVSIA